MLIVGGLSWTVNQTGVDPKWSWVPIESWSKLYQVQNLVSNSPGVVGVPVNNQVEESILIPFTGLVEVETGLLKLYISWTQFEESPFPSSLLKHTQSISSFCAVLTSKSYWWTGALVR